MTCILHQLDIMEPKKPEDIYKTHLENTSKHGTDDKNKPIVFEISHLDTLKIVLNFRMFSSFVLVVLFMLLGQSSNVDSASQNLASSFVNGLINAGFVRDKLLTTDEGNKWIYKNKTYGDLIVVIFTFV